MAKRIAFIGAGNMGGALIKGFLQKREVEPENLIVYDKDAEKSQALAEETGVHLAEKLEELVEGVDVLFLAVKPQDLDDVLDEIAPIVDGVLIVSIAAGVSTRHIEGKTGGKRVIRVMPNTPALVYEMAAGYCLGENATGEDESLVSDLLSSIGIAHRVGENLMDAVTGLSGSGPAYIYLIVKALRDAGIEQGLPEEVASDLAAQTVKGASEMILSKTGEPDALIEAVKSPGGTTIEAMKVLEQSDIYETIKKAVAAATERSKELSG